MVLSTVSSLTLRAVSQPWPVDILRWIILCCQELSWHCQMSSSIPDFYSLDAISNLSPSAVTTKKVPRHCLMSPGGRTTLLERFGFVLISEIVCNHLLFYNLAVMPQSRYFYTYATEEETDAQMSHVLFLLNRQATGVPIPQMSKAAPFHPETSSCTASFLLPLPFSNHHQLPKLTP